MLMRLRLLGRDAGIKDVLLAVNVGHGFICARELAAWKKRRD